ncbi:MAG TPA: sarcosine oxidase subunit gamma family protein [Burkholderiales bacterium]|nr:sarcosine oxidase subunit gamma family protein [Burkholderiales bacterium]
MTHLSLRGSGEQFFAACESVLGMRPPTAPNTVASAAGTTILWLGPDEWLLIDSRTGTDHVIGDLKKALSGIHSAVVDVTSSRKALVVSGERAEEILSKAATLDFSVQAFPVGSCAQTNIARTQGIIQRRGAKEFTIYVRSSFAPYLRAWLDDAATAS